MRATIVLFEGIDGSGKTTQAKLLADRLAHTGCVFAFPNLDPRLPTAKHITRFLQNGKGSGYESYLFLANMLESAYALNELCEYCDLVILDRYFPSTAAYFSAITGSDPLSAYDEFWNFLDNHSLLPEPSIVFYLDIDPEIAVRRSSGDHSYDKDLDLLKRVREGYSMFCTRYGNWIRISCMEDGKQLSPEEINQRVIGQLHSYLHTFQDGK